MAFKQGHVFGSVHLCDTLEGCGRVKHGNRDPGKHGGNDVGFADGAATHEQREEEADEEGSRLVETLLEGVEQVDIELLVFADILADLVEDDVLHELLARRRIRGSEYPRGLERGVGRPLVGFGHLDNVFPTGYCRQDLEWLRQGAALVSRENLSNPGCCCQFRHESKKIYFNTSRVMFAEGDECR